ncbi:Sensory transduction protein LytR [compost metagenome]
MLRIGICDDMQEARYALCCSLERILELRAIENTIYEFSSGDRLLDWMYKHAGELDVIFLDIEMGGSSGLETAHKLRHADANLQIIFVTGYSDFVFDGYSVGALSYLLKPPTADALDNILTRAIAALHLGANDVFFCRNSEGMYRIPKASILYFSSEKRLVTCAAKTRSYNFYARLDEVEENVGASFVRIHQRYLVNVSKIDFIGVSTVQIGEQTLPISRAYQKKAMLSLTRAMLN